MAMPGLGRRAAHGPSTQDTQSKFRGTEGLCVYVRPLPIQLQAAALERLRLLDLLAHLPKFGYAGASAAIQFIVTFDVIGRFYVC